ncbi:uncharacterized protein LOC101449439 [Ceratitis capitata]|uniref:(Mediterranean fruit fly) hypothetical protein n=1 Tax=Ceratitis capitata TaxID=7213 RepID=W8C8H2_CERCA|nr:uncharacterized protein LOC101449439 [Ceratitis capitata]XP_012156176.1 uncharacterized protein LOC101449439 [Ceratitis capitata]XP_012156177.1 uncharacterized protein LOC101449439 [Ceratitis capitata]XP_012156178.1 uncharacterized protein LOC101449439 [Ceratitis capitata]XP_012156179.1 uncharacterized protein LOC101449439 [Ceratitis capitata]XP_020713719.1 uncharacterized protein LOC101449439 [Ceratitis capitata]XP_020713720.1 uncharacterized protein LOC101449439 [Ceratitis capitata]CAD6
MPYEKFNKKRRQWEDNGVLELIKLWKVCAYELRTIKRNGHLYVAMAKQLTALGVPVSALEVHFKVNNLTQRYRQEQKTFETTGIISTWKFYSQVDDVFKSLAGQAGDKRIMTPASNPGTLPSASESPVWKNQMSQQEFNSNNSEGFYKSEYGMHRHFMDHTQPPPNQNNDVNFMASTAAAAAVAAASAHLNPTPNNTNTNGVVPNYNNNNKIKKPTEDYDKFVDIVKNIVDNHKATPDKVDTFGDFIKSYMRRWPDRLQDEAINHITNYVIVKNMENSMNNGGDGVNNRQ